MEIQSHRRMNLKEESRARESNSFKKKMPSKQSATKRKRADSTSSSDLAAISDGEVIDDDALSTDCHDDELLREKMSWMIKNTQLTRWLPLSLI